MELPANVDRAKCLDDLEGASRGEPGLDSYLVRTCHLLRRKPIGEFSTEDLRIMIGQKIGLAFLMPLAAEALVRTPLAEGDFFPGDLLKAVLSVDPGFWSDRPDLRGSLAASLRATTQLPVEVAALVNDFLR